VVERQAKRPLPPGSRSKQDLIITNTPQAGNIALTAAKPPRPSPARQAPTRARTRGSAPCARRGPLRSFR